MRDNALWLNLLSQGRSVRSRQWNLRLCCDLLDITVICRLEHDISIPVAKLPLGIVKFKQNWAYAFSRVWVTFRKLKANFSTPTTWLFLRTSQYWTTHAHLDESYKHRSTEGLFFLVKPWPARHLVSPNCVDPFEFAANAFVLETLRTVNYKRTVVYCVHRNFTMCCKILEISVCNAQYNAEPQAWELSFISQFSSRNLESHFLEVFGHARNVVWPPTWIR